MHLVAYSAVEAEGGVLLVEGDMTTLVVGGRLYSIGECEETDHLQWFPPGSGAKAIRVFAWV